MKVQQGQLNRIIEGMLDATNPQEPEQESTFEISEESLLKMHQTCKDLSQIQYVRLIGMRVSNLDKLDSLVPQIKLLNMSFSRLEKMEGFSKLKELTEAVLCHNSFQEIRSLDECRLLISLDLSHNNISEISGLSQLFKLEKLNLSGNRIPLITNLDGLKNLRSLNMSQNRIKKIDFFPQLPCLEELDLSENLIDMIHPKLFENHKTITELNLSKNRIRSLEFLNQLQNLEKLECASNCLERVQLKVTLEDLEFLDFSGNEITEVNRFEEFFPNLFSLNVSKNSICLEDELGFIYEMDGLCEIDFSENPVCTDEFLVTFLRRHPQLDLVNGKTIHSAGHRFREEIQQVQEEIEKFEAKNEGVTEIIDDNDNLAAQILKAQNIKDLKSLLAQFKKEEYAEKQATQAFMNYYKHLNEEITVEEIRAESEKRRQREMLGDDYQMEDSIVAGVSTAVAQAQKTNQQMMQTKEDTEESEESEEEEEDHRFAGIVRPQNPRSKSAQSTRSNILKHFDQFATLADENSLQGFMTELQNDFGEIRAKYQAIKGVKYIKRHNSMQNFNQSTFNNEDSDMENSSSLQNDALNMSTSSLKNRSSLNRAADKNIIIKKMKQPLMAGATNSLRSSIAISSLGGSQNTILSSSRGAVGLANTLNLPLLPPRANPALQKELKEFKKNLNDNEFLRRIGMGNAQQLAEANMSKTAKPMISTGTGTLATKKSFIERGGSLNKPRNLSATQQFSGQKGATLKLRDMENVDRDIKRDSTSSLATETQFQQTRGIIYSNKNNKAKSKLIDSIQNPSQTKKI